MKIIGFCEPFYLCQCYINVFFIVLDKRLVVKDCIRLG